MSSSLRIVVTGLIAQYPLGGVTWDYLQYVLGLAGLGHEVYYIEDTGQWPYHPAEDGRVKDGNLNVAYLAEIMERFGLGDRWAYRFPWKSQWFGLPDARRDEIIGSADLLINVSGTIEHPDKYRAAHRMAYIDSDPVFTQVKLAKGHQHLRQLIDVHDVLFSFGESPSADTPNTGDTWLPTRQPVVLAEWEPEEGHRDVFTTVMNWNAYKPIEFAGNSYGQKDLEFPPYMGLPREVAPQVLELAANPGKGHELPRDELIANGWQLVHPADACPTLDTYRSYVQHSLGEWSVAKNGYVRGQSGWFSCRSACYLAAARPVVVQETGFSRVLPVGEGLLPFGTLAEARAAILEVAADFPRHSQAARAIAEDYFDSHRVLTDLVDRAMGAC